MIEIDTSHQYDEIMSDVIAKRTIKYYELMDRIKSILK
jgi:hypothetical protein